MLKKLISYWEAGGLNEALFQVKSDILRYKVEQWLLRNPDSTQRAIVESLSDTGQYEKAIKRI